MENPILFYEPEAPYGFLSNFAPFPINDGAVTWKTVEHFYQAQKFNNPNIVAQIHHARTPADAYALGKQYNEQVRVDWHQRKETVMRDALQMKFTQNHALGHWLVATRPHPLVEHAFKDDYWGDGGDGHGKNRLGQLLMNLRQELSITPPYNLIHFIESANLPTDWGIFNMHGFEDPDTGIEHVALTFGNWKKDEPVLIRLHSECLTGDALFSRRCDCGSQLRRAFQNISQVGTGAILYLRQEGRGIGLLNKIRAYHLQDQGADTVEANEALGFAADLRQYDFCRGILHYLNISKVKLMTNNPKKVKALREAGINVVERVPIQEGQNIFNERYLSAKATKLGHMLDVIAPL